MGSIYNVQCECGYKEEDLIDGPGMAMQCYAIVLCKKCHRLSSKYLGIIGFANAEAIQNKRCGHCRCGGIEWYEVSESNNNKCPRCGIHSLAFTLTLLWD